MTPAGAAFPHGRDPDDRNIRIAPTFPSISDVRVAMEGLSTCVLLAAAEKLAHLPAVSSNPADARHENPCSAIGIAAVEVV